MLKRFVRPKNDLTSKTHELYNKFVSKSLDLLLSNGAASEEKGDLIKEDYEDIIKYTKTIERNELLLKELNQEKQAVFQRRKQGMIEKYVDLINILRRSKIISSMDATDLKDFQDQNYQKRDIFSNETPILRILTIEDFKMHFEDFEIVYENLQSRLETKMSLYNKNKAFKIIDKIIGTVDFKKIHSDLEVRRVYYGSTVSQLSTGKSDIDITLMTNINFDERELLRFLWKEIENNSLLVDYEHRFIDLIHIRIPILDIIFPELDVTISFSVNNKLAAINSKLLELYSNLDPRCRMLALLIKIWSKTHKICSAKEGYLSSYAYNLMVTNFLQIHTIPILPSLKVLRAATEEEPVFLERTPTSSVQINFENKIEKIQDEMTRTFGKNERTLENLLLRFFKFYQDANRFENRVLSIKEGKLLKRNSFDFDDNYLYSIEDPFEKHQNPGRYVSKRSPQARRILTTMEKSYKLLKEKKLVEIFQPFDEEEGEERNIIFN